MLARVRVGTTYSPARYLAQRVAPIPLVRQAAFSSTDASDPPLIHHLDLRVGKIVHVEAHAQADHLYVEQVDLGDHPPRTIVSGLVKFIKSQDMLASISLSPLCMFMSNVLG